MDKSIIKENIIRQLELINEQNINLNAYSGKIPQIDLDIIKANIRKLYEQIYELEKANQIVENIITTLPNDITPQVIAEIKETPEKPLVIINENQLSEKEKPLEIPEDINVNTEQKFEEETEHKVEEIEVIFTPEPKAIIEEKVVEIKKEETIKETIKHEEEKQKPAKNIDLFGSTNISIADKYKTESKSINDKMQKAKTDKSISSRMSHQNIKDLKSAIGINEKFLFINELFKGNMKAYNDSIILLNDCDSHDKAMEILENYRVQYKWESDMVAFLTLKDFVDRKHQK